MVVEGNYHSASVLAKSLDRYVASIHPGKLDAANLANTSAPLWPVSDYLVGRLVREIASASRGRSLDEDPRFCPRSRSGRVQWSYELGPGGRRWGGAFTSQSEAPPAAKSQQAHTQHLGTSLHLCWVRRCSWRDQPTRAKFGKIWLVSPKLELRST